MTTSRREFLTQSTVALAGIVPASRLSRVIARDAEARAQDARAPFDDETAKALAGRALETARAAGATYADVRIVTNTGERWSTTMASRDSAMPVVSVTSGIGVRVLSNGCWGYASRTGAGLTPDVAAQLGKEAVVQAKLLANGAARTIELAPTPVVSNGRWATPIQVDPFQVSWEEKIDTFEGLSRYYEVQPMGAQLVRVRADFIKTEQGFASTDGTWCVQTLYRTMINQLPLVGVSRHWRTGKTGNRAVDGVISTAGAGWEYLLQAPLETEATRLIAQADDKRFAVPSDIGRYDVVFDGAAMAKLVDAHLGSATTLDRAMGYRANVEGTSYLGNPLALLGTHVLGSSLLNVTANRSMSGGAATVKWDDEGVEPDEAVLVRNGVLTDYQTTRESANWLAPYYQKAGKPVRSHGGAMGGLDNVPRQGSHNLVMAPASEQTSFETLCAGVTRGLAVLSGVGYPDHQGLNSTYEGDVVYEINQGKIGRAVSGAVLMLRAPQLWKGLSALGGTQTVRAVGLGREGFSRTVSAPAAIVTQVAVTTESARRGF